jgi:phosphoglycolate phosphatase-like HAD superfamily hydrolase
MTSLARAVDLLVFDFDGTICQSAHVKTDAFYQLYLDEQGEEFAAIIREYHLEHAGMSRFDKIRYYEEKLLGRPCTDDRMEEIAARFGRIVRDQVVAAPLVPGVAEFFENHLGEVPMVVASATPTEELRQIVAARGISHWFEDVRGSPTPKGAIVSAFVAERCAEPGRVVTVGDQRLDIEAAREAGVHFVGYRPAHEDRLFDTHTLVVSDFRSLAGAIVRVVSGAAR